MSKRKLTYAQMAEDIMRYHSIFETVGIKKGDKISLVGKNSSYWGTLYMATTLYGAVIVPILDEFNPVDMLHILKHSDSKLLFCDNDIYTKLLDAGVSKEETPDILAVVSLVGGELLYAKDDNISDYINGVDDYIKIKYPSGYKVSHIKYAKVSNSDLAMISYTSGTTSLTKGVMLSYNNLVGNIMFALNNYGGLGVKLERSLAVLPLAHSYGLAFSFLAHIASGAEVTFLGRIPSPKIVLDACKEIRPNLLLFVPLVLEKIYTSRIEPLINKKAVALALKTPVIGNILYRIIGLKIYKMLGGVAEDIIVGGAALNPDIEMFFYKTKLPFLVGYGMTECAPLISYIHHSKFIPTSVGKALDGLMSVKILKNKKGDSSGIGEIIVKGENVMMGYYKDPDTTEAAFTKDGWLKTGDLGYIDRDGNIYIKGRSKTMLLGPSGENIYPEAIESKLANTPYISECIVIQNVSNRLEAWVYPNYDYIKEKGHENDNLQSLMDSAKDSVNKILAKYENIAAIRISSEPFPKTPKHTIKRYCAEKYIRENNDIAV